MQLQDNHTEFEDLLQWHADRHRMYPSDKVWQHIQTELHGEKRWPALTICTITILVLLTLATAFLQRKDQHSASMVNSQQWLQKQKQIPSLGAVIQQQTDVAALTRRTIQQATLHSQQDQQTVLPAVSPQMMHTLVQVIAQGQNSLHTTAPSLPAKDGANAEYAFWESRRIETLSQTIGQEPKPEIAFASKKIESPATNLAAKTPFVYKPTGKKRWSISYYASGSSSFRRLTDEKMRPYNSGNYIVLPNSAYNSLDINQVVIQAPGYGLELGANVGHQLSKRLTVYSGLQLNYREYRIQGFGWNTEAVAIALRGADTLNTVSNYRLNGGTMPVTLRNRGWELSVPVGFRWDALQHKRISAGIGASLQPTVILNKTPFAVSTDYKSYADGSALLRQFNLNTAVEGYIRIESADGRASWQFGPQIRYQQLSTLDRKYPIKEFLYDYGLKLGYNRRF